MSLFIDKYLRYCINNGIIYQKELAMLKKISTDNLVPHIIFFGQSGSAVQIITEIFLEMLYGKQIYKLKNNIHSVRGSGNKDTNIIIKQSNYHIVIEPNGNNFDRYIIQDIVNPYAKKGHLNMFRDNKSFKTILISDVGYLSYYGQTSLRRTMEIYSDNCKFVMWCNSLSKVIEPLTSRCTCFRIELPDEDKLIKVILSVSLKEKINLNISIFSDILTKSNGDIKKVLWLLNFCKYNLPFNNSYDDELSKVITGIMEKNINNIPEIRDQIYKIMITGIPNSTTIKDIINNLLINEDISEETKLQIMKYTARYDYNITKGRRGIIHLDALTNSFFNIIK